MATTSHHSRRESPKQIKKAVNQHRIDAIASTIDTDKLDIDTKDALKVDRFGRVEMSPDHPGFTYWTMDKGDE